MVKPMSGNGLNLYQISNRGLKVWPDGLPETLCVDEWRLRFKASGATATPRQVISLLERLVGAGFDLGAVEMLVTFDGEAGYTASQGE
jgi:isocitrate dehydrogenase